ncbi:hypothetical protein [Streptomyces sp. JJ36]|uniref:hypothetical protein n=1 Tax=Streptomyces sp. JJ36 TaxID=2736645 RepID=UPI001F2A6A82|nr:hypothetical protein [Streptomyces sp. JJ36]MCF6526411.1 hypothetical protein [Streptomyces sp. JJ36]
MTGRGKRSAAVVWLVLVVAGAAGTLWLRDSAEPEPGRWEEAPAGSRTVPPAGEEGWDCPTPSPVPDGSYGVLCARGPR